MSENPDRDGVIELLEKLGDDDDAEVLAAARKLHAQVSNSGLTWDDLLLPEDGAATDITEDEDEDGAADAGPSEDVGEVVASGEAAGDMKLIERLLAGKDISAMLREELGGYKEDIKEGEFTTADRRYLQALEKRLSGSSKSKGRD